MRLDFDGQTISGEHVLATLEMREGRATWRDRSPLVTASLPEEDLFAAWRAMNAWGKTHFPNGGALGFLGYDWARELEPRAFLRPLSQSHDLGLPQLRVTFFQELSFTSTVATSTAADSCTEEIEVAADAKYLQDVDKVAEYIACGDIYQANLTRRWEYALKVSPQQLYRRLRAIQSVGFGGCLEWDDFAIVSNSPERFVRLQGRELLTQPIKGTLQRGRDALEDEKLRAQLQKSSKDRAENVMIVDLLRNDLGRVCEFGSVRVPELWRVQTLQTLHHLVSSVTGTLRDGLDGLDVLRALFPCGSITGAPKIRAMQIIDELETVPRGASMGALGYWKFDGDMDWNVAIRTITCIANRAWFHTGGGIVADSQSEDEWREMNLKARAIRCALNV